MKRKLLSLCGVLLSLLLLSCEMEAPIPENAETFSQYRENKELYLAAVDYMKTVEYDALLSRQDYYPIEGGEEYAGLYLQNMTDLSHKASTEPTLLTLFAETNTKLVDSIHRDEVFLCVFDFCLPGKNFDYGFYYTSGNEPLYFGDPSLELMESGNGFTFEKKASYGVKFTYYTEKIEDNIFYYEIA